MPPSVIRCEPSELTLLEPMKVGLPLFQPANITTWLIGPSPGTLKQITSPGLALASEVDDQRGSLRRLLANPCTLSLCSPALIWPAFCSAAETKLAQQTL